MSQFRGSTSLRPLDLKRTLFCRWSIVWALCLAFVAVMTEPVSKAQSNVPLLVPKVKQVIYAPFAGIADFANWEIEIANRSNEDVPATVTAYSTQGKPFPSSAVTLGANRILRINIRTLAPEVQSPSANGSNEPLTIGGITVAVVAKPMAIAAQVTLSDFRGGFGNIDSIVLPDSMFPSSKADAVWWQPEAGRSFLILGNSSTQPITAELDFGGSRQSVALASHATIIRPLQQENGEDANRLPKTLSVHAEGSGPAGTLRVSGYTVSQGAGFMNVIRAYDPLVSTEPTAYANGLHFLDADNHLVVKNLTASPINVWGTLYPLSSSGSRNTAIPTVLLAAYASGELFLPAQEESLDGASLKLDSSGPTGSFVASYVSHAQVDHLTRSMPFKDIGDRANTTGGYPWRLDGNYESHTYITNIGKVRGAFGAFLDPQNGNRYVIDTHFLEPGETAIIDYRKLRDQQTPDRNGQILPTDVKFGTVQWFPLFFDGTQHFIGRTEVLDRATGIASSFSCGSCPCSPNVNSAYTSPSSVTVSMGGTASVRAAATMSDPCNFNPIPDMTIIPPSWSTPPAFTMTAGAATSTLKGVSPGSGSYITSNISDEWVYNPFESPECMKTGSRIVNPEGTGTVAAPFASRIVSTITSHAVNTGTSPACSAGQAGWYRKVSKIVTDQRGANIVQGGQQLTETVTIGTPNNLGITGVQTGTATTNASGLFDDEFFVCTPACPASTGQTNASQTIKDTLSSGKGPYTLSPNTLVYKCGSITVNGQ
jgi:peptidoglycan hydrolase-like protein with peptidoglycan-binding domain